MISWWRHQMETFSALLALCAGNSPVPGEFPSQRPVTRSFDVFFDLRMNKLLSKQKWGCWFETPSCSLWRHWNVITTRGTYNDTNYISSLSHCYALSLKKIRLAYPISLITARSKMLSNNKLLITYKSMVYIDSPSQKSHSWHKQW